MNAVRLNQLVGSRVPRAGDALILVLMFAIAGVVLFPIFWMLLTTLKTPAEVFSQPPTIVPGSPTLDNYAAAVRKVDFGRYVLNSFIVSGAVTAIHVPLVFLAGFGLAKFRFPGAGVLLLVFLGSLMIPLEAIMVPLFLIIVDLGWVDSFQGLIGPMAANAFGVLLVRQYAIQLPNSVIEAARVEGASWARIMTRIAVPISWPAIGAAAVIIWRESWDAFLWPLLVVRSPDLYTLPLGLARFQQSFATNYSELMAISTLAMIPLVFVYLVAQRSFIRGIASIGTT